MPSNAAPIIHKDMYCYALQIFYFVYVEFLVIRSLFYSPTGLLIQRSSENYSPKQTAKLNL